MVLFQPRLLEMIIVEDRVFDAGGGNIGNQALLPDAFRHPHAPNARLKQLLQISGIGSNLADPIRGWDHRQDRLVESAAHDLDLTPSHQSPQAVHIFRLVVDQPFHQAAAGVQGQRDFRIAFDQVEKGSVTVAVGAFKDAVEIPDRLMIVQTKDEPDTHSDSFLDHQLASGYVNARHSLLTTHHFFCRAVRSTSVSWR